MDLSVLRAQQLLIAFSEPVTFTDLDDQSVMLLVPHRDPNDPSGMVCWCQFPAKLEPLNLAALCKLDSGHLPVTGSICNALHLDFDVEQLIGVLRRAEARTVRVQVHGDLIRDEKGRGLDGNHLPPWLPNVPKTGDGLPGGLFESSFTLNLPF